MIFFIRLVEIPAYICGVFVNDKFGRRPSLAFGLLASGAACLVTGLVSGGLKHNRDI